MRKLAIFVALLVMCFMLVAEASAGWGSLPCAPVGAISRAQVTKSYEWRDVPGAPEQSALFLNGKQIGGYNHETGFYLPLTGNQWGGPSTAPITPPFSRGDRGGPSILTGLAVDKLAKHDRYSCSHGEIADWQALAMVRGDVQDDSKSGHVTVISKDPAVRAKAAADWEEQKKRTGGNSSIRFQVYDPDALPNRSILAPFALERDTRFQQRGTVVLAQAAGDQLDGRSRPEAWYDYAGVSTLVEALRKVDPTYNPNVSPFPVLPGLPQVNWELIGLGVLVGCVLVLALRNRQQ